MSKRSDRYNDSPTLKRDDDSGKMKATKKPTENAKASAQEGSGTEGMAVNEMHMKELDHKHSKERMELFHKHEKEHMDMRHNSMKEESEGSGSGQEKINKTEKGSK